MRRHDFELGDNVGMITIKKFGEVKKYKMMKEIRRKKEEETIDLRFLIVKTLSSK
jgi:hypothetical protein